jgi:DNA-binding MarR family transcriptional regulator
MENAETASQEITRLVLGVNRRVGLNHGDRVTVMASGIGLQSLALLPHLGDFLLDGLLTRQIATLRLRYQPEGEVTSLLAQLEDKGLIKLNRWGFVATDRLRPLLKALHSARADVARDLWIHNEVEVSVVTETAKAILDGVTPEHIVAHTHNRVRKPLDRYSLLCQRLVTLRYIRQQDHAEAWTDQNLTAGEIAVMTALWRDEPIEIDEPPLASLRAAGHVLKSEPPRLSARGKRLRRAIEDDTNSRTKATFEVLDEATMTRFVETLGRLPD